MLSFAERRLRMMLRLPKTPLSMVVVFAAFFSATTRAQSPGPREFLNTPVDQAIVFVDYLATSAESVDANLPLPNNQTVSQVVSPTLLASFPFDNRYAGLSLSVPYSKVEVDGPGGKVETSGFNDQAFAVHANIFGLPALRRDQIAEAIPQTFMSFHLTVNPPLGSYDRNAPVNAGANRWAFTPLVNLNIPLNQGVSWIEVYSWGRFFTTNNEFQGSNQLAQDPLGIVAAWYSRNLGKKMYAGIGGYYDYGGESFVNRMPQHDTSNAVRGSVGISRKFGKYAVTFRYENTASKPNAAPSSGLLLLRVSIGSVFKF